ncbi:MAG: peptide ABC transporter substrate-binding protein [Paracoccaceae bacterium]
MTLSFKALLLSTSLLVATSGGAFAEMVLNRGNDGDPESLDPHKVSTVSEANIMRDLFYGLVMQDAKAEMIPGAAESWEVSEDGKIYTFKLRADGKWSDGAPVTAQDFVFSWQRVVDPATAAEYAYMLEPVVNAAAVTAGEKKPEELGVKAIDDLTFEVTLNAPTPYFLEMLTHQATYPVSKANVEALAADFTKPGNLVSNGPFILAAFTPNDKLELRKNAEFFEADQVILDVVNYFPTEDRSAAVKRFEGGELHMNTDFPAEQYADLKAKFGDQVKVGPYLGTYYYVFKLTEDPWKDVQLRTAISMAIDREYLAEEVWQNTMVPAYSFVPPGIEGYEARLAAYADMPQIDREDKAAEILAALGYTPENPLKMQISFNTSENHNNTAVAIQEQLKPLGIEVSLFNVDSVTHFAMLEAKGDFDLARTGWIADYKDPENFLALCKTGTGNNHGEYSNPAFDDLMANAAASADPVERMDLLSDAEQLAVAEELCIMPLLHYGYHSVVSDKVKGWEPNIMDIHPTRFMSVE